MSAGFCGCITRSKQLVEAEFVFERAVMRSEWLRQAKLTGLFNPNLVCAVMRTEKWRWWWWDGRSLKWMRCESAQSLWGAERGKN